MKRLVLLLLALGGFAPTRSEAQAVMRHGDFFEVRLTGMSVEYASDFAVVYMVDSTGAARLPYIGHVKAAGLSAPQLAHAIEHQLVAQKIFTNPTAVVTTLADQRRVTVGGAVRAPQAVAWTDGMTLSTAILRSGSEWGFGANTRKVKLTRDGKVSYYNLNRADKDPMQNPKLLPGDEIIVPE